MIALSSEFHVLNDSVPGSPIRPDNLSRLETKATAKAAEEPRPALVGKLELTMKSNPIILQRTIITGLHLKLLYC